MTRSDRGGGCSTPLPVSPTPTGAILHRYRVRGRSSLCRQCEHPAEILSLSPCTVSGLSPRTARPIGRGREEARNAPGGGGVLAKDVQPETQATWEGGAVSASPLPVSPTPTGRYPIDTVPGKRSSLCRQCEHPAEILSLSPCTVSGLSPRTARPIGRGREEARNAPGGGGVLAKDVQPETQATWEGGAVSASPLPVSPTPRGVISLRYSARGRAPPHPVPGETPPEESCLCPLARPPPAGWRGGQPQKRSQRRVIWGITP